MKFLDLARVTIRFGLRRERLHQFSGVKNTLSTADPMAATAAVVVMSGQRPSMG